MSWNIHSKCIDNASGTNINEVIRLELDDKIKRFRGALQGRGTSPHKLPFLVSARSSLRVEISSWKKEILARIPCLADGFPPCEELRDLEDDEDLEDTLLPQNGTELLSLVLPSNLEAAMLSSKTTVLYAALEMKLRVGHAYDLLAST